VTRLTQVERRVVQKKQVVIIGSGPAGYTAGIYAGRARLQTTLFAGIKSGGQLMWTSDIENFPGFAQGIAGPKLMMEMRQQTARFDVDIQDKFVTAVDFSQRPFKIWTRFPQGISYESIEYGGEDAINDLVADVKKTQPDLLAESVIIAAGATANLLGVSGEKEFLGRGVSTCAVCDSAFYKDKVTYVIGGGDSAMEDTMALTKFAKSVTVIHRRDEFRASKIMQERVLNHPKVSVRWNTTLDEVIGDKKVGSIKVTQSGKQLELPADGVFLAIGHKPVTSFYQGQIELDEHGYIVNRLSLSRSGVELAQKTMIDDKVSFPTMTSVPGVFAAGDVVDIRYRQAITASGQGCAAALDAERWLQRQ
jgi:thioredoxin reductase (NADPH)